MDLPSRVTRIINSPYKDSLSEKCYRTLTKTKNLVTMMTLLSRPMKLPLLSLLINNSVVSAKLLMLHDI